MRGKSRLSVGKSAEDAACRHLREKGFLIIDRNLRNRDGEIDILARKGEYLVAVEVRSRKLGSPVLSGELFPMEKRRRVVKVARGVAGKYWKRGDSLRFDVVIVTHDGGEVVDVEHIENAFSGDGTVW